MKFNLGRFIKSKIKNKVMINNDFGSETLGKF